MILDSTQSVGVRILIIAAAFVIVVAGMRASSVILVPLLLSLFIAIISAPPLFWLRRKGFPNWLAMIVVIAGILGIAFGMGAMVGTSMDDFSKSLPVYQARLQEDMAALIAWFQAKGVTLPAQAFLDSLDPAKAIGWFAGMLNALRSVLTNIFLILIAVIFILFEASSFPAKLDAVLRGSQASIAQFGKVITNIKHYMWIKTWTGLATGIAVAIWLAILGVDFAVVWGLLAFLLNFVPNIGSIIAAVPAVLLAFLQLGVGAALWSGLGYVVVNVVIGIVIEPRVLGRSLGLSTLVVFFSLVFWGWVLGPVGMFLSVPLTMAVKIALDSSEHTRWVAILLGSETYGDAASATPAEGPLPDGSEADVATPSPGDVQ
ncbi:MAG: AI-2E family transporter [Gammaproteobacteria bacterium]|nr:AI-2E family transporter [Gammaproteobacteria bacterium]